MEIKELMPAPELFSYNEYKDKVTSLFVEGNVTGDVQSEDLLKTTEMNLHRMQRIGKNNKISSDLYSTLQNIKGNWKWYLLAEGWCADASQNIPIIAQIAAVSTGIDLKIILRDENPEIMNRYLTNGGKAIPKLICVDVNTGEELGVWGPRPESIQRKVTRFKKEYPNAEKSEFSINLHKWYAKDKGGSLQKEFLTLITKWNEL